MKDEGGRAAWTCESELARDERLIASKLAPTFARAAWVFILRPARRARACMPPPFARIAAGSSKPLSNPSASIL